MQRFVLVTGASYSGTTLLALMLGGHPHIATVGEMTGPVSYESGETYRCSCGLPLCECEFWRSVADRMRRYGLSFDHRDFGTRYVPRDGENLFSRLQFSYLRAGWAEDARDWLYARIPRYRNHRNGITHRSLALAEAVLEVSGKNVFLDTSKTPDRVKPLTEALGERLRIIHMVRDGRDVVRSAKKYTASISTARAARDWHRVNARSHRVLRRYVPYQHRFLLRYEDLVVDPEARLADICRFLGVAHDEACLDLAYPVRHVIGNNNARLGGRSRVENPQVVTGRSPPIPDVHVFERIAGGLNRRYGYG